MRIAILADIHGNLPALEAVVRDFSRRSIDAVVNLGDCVSGPLLPLETARFLMEQDWLHIAGNHERQLLTQGPGRWCPSDEFAHSQLTPAELKWLASLKPSARFSPEVVLCHGTPTSDSEYFLETVEPARVRAASLPEIDERLGKVDAALIACGHTHTPRSVRASTGQLIVNPGSVGLPAYDDVLPYPHVIETGSPDARYAIVERLPEHWVVTLITVPYAYEAMAKLAEKHLRNDWARALATGFIS
jgi:predicted phosphodiesterase